MMSEAHHSIRHFLEIFKISKFPKFRNSSEFRKCAHESFMLRQYSYINYFSCPALSVIAENSNYKRSLSTRPFRYGSLVTTYPFLQSFDSNRSTKASTNPHSNGLTGGRCK